MMHLLPADPQRDAHHGGQLEAIHLAHVVARWLLEAIAVVLAAWLLVLLLSLLGWAVWSLVWLIRRPGTRKAPQDQRSAGMDGNHDG
jgi:hypothetical protein